MRRFLKPLLIGTVAIGVLGAIAFGIALAGAGARAGRIEREAQERYGEDRVMSLVRYIDDPVNPYRQQNFAIGMIANLGDIRALPTLEKHYTGDECAHHRALCQYELVKAIRKAKLNEGPSSLNKVKDYFRDI